MDAYLAGVSPEDLALLDAGTRRAGRHLAEMAADLDRVNARLDVAFDLLERREIRRNPGRAA